jgi:hypothetical protein
MINVRVVNSDLVTGLWEVLYVGGGGVKEEERKHRK